MSNVKGLRCRECGREYDEGPFYVCEDCFGPLEIVYDYEEIAAQLSRERIAASSPTMWRYGALLPAAPDKLRGDIGTGLTPLIHARNLGKALGLQKLYVKNDCVNPSYSFKDRVVGVAVSKAREFGFDTIACASTGNLANSVAAHAAHCGMEAYVFVPTDLEQAKIVASSVYGPNVLAVDGNYDQVNRRCTMIADEYHWAFVNVNVRPYYAEGPKTLGYEVAEQLGWHAPDHVVVPMASGSLLTKIAKSFGELANLGLIEEHQTHISGAQSAGCSPIATAFETASDRIIPVKPHTIAKSLAIGSPADGHYALRVIRESGGYAASVTEDEIVEGIKLLASTEGIFAETAGGVTVGVLKKLVESGRIAPDELTVAYITGNGLKTSVAVEGRLNPLTHIGPTMGAFERTMKDK